MELGEVLHRESGVVPQEYSETLQGRDGIIGNDKVDMSMTNGTL